MISNKFFKIGNNRKGYMSILTVLCICVFKVNAQQIPVYGPAKMSVQKEMKMGGMGAAGLMPPGIMVGEKGKWMIVYEFMSDKMKGNLLGAKKISEESILQQYMASPTDMSMQMHMAMVMYTPAKKLTLMLSVPYLVKSMNHITGDGMRFQERTTGLSDISLRGLYTFYTNKAGTKRLLLNGAIAFPTGSIQKKMAGMRLEYPMQLGSGTVSLMPGIIYLGHSDLWGWEAEFISTLRTGHNKNGYRFGNYYQPSIWAARKLASWLSISAGVRGAVRNNIQGADPELDIMDEPTKDPALQGGKSLELNVGINIHPVTGLFKGDEFYSQLNEPVFQNLDGPQLKRKSVITIGWQKEL